MDTDTIHLALFRGYGTPKQLFFSGRALRNAPDVAEPGASLLQNLAASFNRIESDEAPDVTVRAVYRGEAWETVTDEDGYFFFALEPATAPATPGWQEVTVSWVNAASDRSGPPQTAYVLTPPLDATFGVISDIDDTILASYIPSPARMALELLLKNAYTRATFGGAPAFYRALRDGPGGLEDGTGNPIFYVSLSPWNLYELIEQFFAINEIPLGPLLLRDYGLHMLRSLGQPSPKGRLIQDLLESYPDLRFLLLGDSGQTDPEIYAEIAGSNPGRILAVYIRDVSGGVDLARCAEVAALGADLAALRVDLLLSPDTTDFAVHARGKGWIV
jgi:phosphatidate phosphatase APP1